MASHSALTEEGRTRIRNFQGRLTSYVLLWLVIGAAVTIAAIWLKTRYGYLPLQRLYLSQYMKASIKAFIPHKNPSRYIILIRVIHQGSNGQKQIIGCTDEEVILIRDTSGLVRFDPKVGPFFRLREGVPYEYFYWGTIWQTDAEMYIWLRDRIYQKRSLLGLYWFCFLPFPLTVITGIIISAKLDLRINREYEEGRLLRGIRLLSRREYETEMRETEGIGLPVFESQRSAR